MKKRILEIINEATRTRTISRVTYQEREMIGKIYQDLTGENADILCNGCILNMCEKLNKNKIWQRRKL